MNETKLIDQMRSKFGDSSEASRNAVIEAHEGMEKLNEWALLWAKHHGVIALNVNDDLIVAYATAVDLGYRIGKGV